MNETMLQYWNRLKQYWNKFSKAQKITLVTTLALIILSISIVTYSLSRTEYVVAFRDLQPSDAASIKQYLESSKIPYHLSTDGKNIEVPAKEAANITVDVSSQGLIRNGSIGYAAFRNNQPFGMSDREFEVKNLDAIQGELQQLINSNAAVSNSKVLITLPEKTVFVRQNGQDQSSAAVVVNLKQGYQLDQKQIDTMYNLVSKGVKNLPPDNITISNQYGDLLPYSKASGAGSIGSGDVAVQQFQIKKQLEQDVQKSVMSLLGPVLGSGKVVPLATASINFDKKSSERNAVEPVVDQKGLEISVQEIQKSYTSDGNSQGGIPGTGTTDVPNYPASSNSGKANSEEVQRTVNYEVNRIKTEVQSSPFVLSDLTISVGIEPPDRNDPNSLTQQTKDAVQSILVNIVKASLANSDKRFADADYATRVTVFQHSFATPADGNASKATNWYLYGGLGVVALALAAIGGYVVSRNRRRRAAELEEAALPEKMEFPTIDFENVSNESQVRKQLESLAKKKPEEFVNLLRTWLVDE